MKTPEELSKELSIPLALATQVAKAQNRKPPSAVTEVETKDWSRLEATCRDYMQYRLSDNYCEDDDWTEYIFEAALEAMYGPTVWKAVNAR